MKKFYSLLFVIVSLFSLQVYSNDVPAKKTFDASEKDPFVQELGQRVLEKLKNPETSQQTMEFLKHYYALRNLSLQGTLLETLNEKNKPEKKGSIISTKIKEGLSNILLLGAEGVAVFCLAIICLKLMVKNFPSILKWILFDQSPYDQVASFFRKIADSVGATIKAPITLIKTCGNSVKKIFVRA
ncbi:MAG: hypothetical protein V1855_00740 [bacterium]